MRLKNPIIHITPATRIIQTPYVPPLLAPKPNLAGQCLRTALRADYVVHSRSHLSSLVASAYVLPFFFSRHAQTHGLPSANLPPTRQNTYRCPCATSTHPGFKPHASHSFA